MSTPTPETPPNDTRNTAHNEPNSAINSNDNEGNNPSSTMPLSSESKAEQAPVDAPIDDREKAPTTDVSLISSGNKPRRYKKDNPSFFMQRGYQILLVIGLIAAFLLVMIYQTLFGRITQPAQKVTIGEGDTYYGLLAQWQREIPLFSASIAKLYIKAQADGPLHAGIYPLPENPTIAEALNILGQGAKVAMVEVQIIEGKTVNDLYQNLRDNEGIVKEVLIEGADNESIAQALDLAGILPESVKSSSDPIVSYNLEGWFTPDTYYYGEGATDKQVLLDL